MPCQQRDVADLERDGGGRVRRDRAVDVPGGERERETGERAEREGDRARSRPDDGERARQQVPARVHDGRRERQHEGVERQPRYLSRRESRRSLSTRPPVWSLRAVAHDVVLVVDGLDRRPAARARLALARWTSSGIGSLSGIGSSTNRS
jgi:hypothetical protein